MSLAVRERTTLLLPNQLLPTPNLSPPWTLVSIMLTYRTGGITLPTFATFLKSLPPRRSAKYVGKYFSSWLFVGVVLMLFSAKLKKRRATTFQRVLGISIAPKHQILHCAHI
jgi:uncharacterized membrane protein required for colicin V production